MDMTKEEFSLIVKGMKSIYTDPKFIANKYSFDMWYRLLSGYTYKQVSLAVETYMRVGVYTPYPADIIKCIALQDQSSGRQISAEEAWALVSKACSNGNYEYREEYHKLPEAVQKAVGNPYNIHEWAAVSRDEFSTVIHSNFLKAFQASQKREAEYRLYPQELIDILEGNSTIIEDTVDEEIPILEDHLEK